MLFSKKKLIEQPKQEFAYEIIMRNGVIHSCKGLAVNKNNIAIHLSNIVEDCENNYFTSADGGKLVLWCKEIEYIKVR